MMLSLFMAEKLDYRESTPILHPSSIAWSFSLRLRWKRLGQSDSWVDFRA